MKPLSERRIVRLKAPGALLALAGLLAAAAPAGAQEIRYSWLDMSFLAQDVDRQATQVPVPGQTVDIDAQDGAGVRFRGSLGTWNNFYLFFDYGSTDIDVDAVVTNIGGEFPASDEFDFTTIRGGVGLRFPVGNSTDVYAELSYDSTDFDFGSFAGENFDLDEQDLGGTIGVRTLLGDNFEVRTYGRYTNVGDVDLTAQVFDSDVLYGVGFGWTLIRGLSIVGDFESGEFSSYSLGFRLDLDED